LGIARETQILGSAGVLPAGNGAVAIVNFQFVSMISLTPYGVLDNAAVGIAIRFWTNGINKLFTHGGSKE